MRFLMTAILSLGLLGLGLVSHVRAADEKKDDASGETKVSAKKEKAPAAPNFGVFALPFESVETLGLRLALARKKTDPVALALLATEIGVNEKVSGKKAAVTAADLSKEAVELAKMRRQQQELEAMALLVKEEGTAKELTKLAATAKKEAPKEGEKERGFHYLKVTNTTDVHAHVHANGHSVGHVPPYSTRTFHTPHLKHRTHIHLRAHDHMGDVWRSDIVTGDFLTYHWTLVP